MITQWDIISSLSPDKGADVSYALVMDGTGHDAQVVAQKLRKYIHYKPTQALPPFIYQFQLPSDLDEDTQEQIQLLMRQAVEQANKDEFIIPGGPLGNPLFSDTATNLLDLADIKEKPATPPPPPPTTPGSNKTIDLSNIGEEDVLHIVTNQPKPTHHDVESTEEHRKKWVSTQTLDQFFNTQKDTQPLVSENESIATEPVQEELQNSASAMAENLSTEPIVAPTVEETTPAEPMQESLAKTASAAPIQEPFVVAETKPIEQAPVAEPIAPQNQPAQPAAITEQPHEQPPVTETQNSKPAVETNSLAAKNSTQAAKEDLLQRIESTSSQQAEQPLEDIFLAETKYDIFVDISKETPQNKTAAALTQKNKDTGKITPNTPPPDLPKVQQAQTPEKTMFNVFDQKIKEQTSLIDIEDVAEITQRIPAKDLSFAEHAQIAEKTPTVSPTTPPSLRNIEEEKSETVMDPFEQLLAGRKLPAKEQQPSKQEAKPVAKKEADSAPMPKPASISNAKDMPSPEPAPKAPKPLPAAQAPKTAPKPVQMPSAKEAAPVPPLMAVPQQPVAPKQPAAPKKPILQNNIKAEKKQENRVFPIPTASTESSMNENQGEKKTFIHLKRKEQAAQPPAVPMPPKPTVPQVPQPATPAMPEMPQPHSAHTILRRRTFSKTMLEKTTTIDHSIELPLSELKKHNWPLEVPLVPTYTLENMTISVNRFAHATAISVIENPGKLYNPLVLHGASGTGKTHFLHAIGYALSKKYGQENIFITNGVRLSRGIQRYIMEGNIAKFEEFVSSVKALLIDDIHLISINEQNRVYLSKLLNDFIAQQKQIVITSKYPPENLAKLEELLDFKLDSGWISDLKQAHGPARMRIIQNMLTSNGINITNEDINRFFGHPNMSLGTVVRSIRRVRVLEKLIFPNLDPEKRSLMTIFDQLLATKGEDQSSIIAQKSIDDIQSASVKGNGEWGRIGFFYPQNNSNMMNWMLFALQQRAKELGIPGGPELAVRSSYSTENIISSAFKIANLCDNKKLKGAVILGPNMNACEPSVRENFYDILTHMLEVMLIRCGVINHEEVTAPSTYVKILAELLR